jgi:aryl-alcohol dehydrogenase-like predicted oxidoreductase
VKTRSIGGVEVGEVGLGCMGMTHAYGSRNDEESLRVLDRALELGVDFWDTADIYGPKTNEELLGRFLRGRRDRVFLATKCGIVYDRSMSAQESTSEGAAYLVDASPDYIKRACDASLQRLGTDHIDIYYLHRADRRTPIEETMGAMADLVAAGKIRHVGLSEVSTITLRRAHAVHPVAALQNEYSLWTRDHEVDVIPTCRELGIAFVAYSPLGRGFLTGEITTPDALPEGDWRRGNPRFQGENFYANMGIVETVREIARYKGASPAQVALAWLLARGEDIIPIPGTKRVKFLEQNVAAAELHLTAAELGVLSRLEPPTGARYNEAMMANIGG